MSTYTQTVAMSTARLDPSPVLKNLDPDRRLLHQGETSGDTNYHHLPIVV